MGIVQRKGLNKLRHVEVDVLWIQEQQARRLLPLRKVPGQDNPSDMATKNVSVALIDQYLARLNLAVAAGRAAIAPKLSALGSHELPVRCANQKNIIREVKMPDGTFTAVPEVQCLETPRFVGKSVTEHCSDHWLLEGNKDVGSGRMLRRGGHCLRRFAVPEDRRKVAI